MAGCKFDNPLQLNNLVENHEALFELEKNQTAETTDQYLKTTQASFIKTSTDKLYQVKGGSAKLATTITKKISEKVAASYTTPPSAEQQAIGQMRMDVGTFVHSLNEIMIKDIIGKVQDMSVEDALAYLDTLTVQDVFRTSKQELLDKRDEFQQLTLLEQGAGSTLTNFEALFDGAREVMRQVYNHQKFKNSKLKTTGKPRFYVEQMIVDPVSDIGGTIDFLVLYSDNTAGVFDFKTKIPKKAYLDNQGNIITDKFVTAGDMERYKAQLASIGKILKERLGVKQIVQNRIVPIQVNVGWDKTTGNYDGKIKKIVYGSKQNKFLAQIVPLPELTGFKDLDEFLLSLDKKISSYTAKLKSDKSKAAYYKQKIDDLKAAKRNILVHHSLNDLIKYTKDLLDATTDEMLNAMTLEELRDVKDELNALKFLAGATYEYRDYLSKSGSKSAQAAKEDFEENIKNISIAVNDRLYEVEQKLYNERLNDAVNKLTGYEITNELGEFHSFVSEGLAGKYFNQLSQFENPIFKALRAKLTESQFKIRQKVKKVIEDIVEKDDALRNWMRENGKNEQWLINSLVDKDESSASADNFHLKLSKEFRERVNKLRKDKNATELAKIYKPTDGYEAWYKQTYEAKQKYFKNKFLDEKEYKRALNLWVKTHDLTLNANGTPKHEDAWVESVRSGKVIIRPEVEEQNLSQEYKYIRSVKPLHEYYLTFEKYNKEFRKMLGVDYFELPNNFIPNIRKSNIDRLLDNGVVNGTKDVLNNFMESMNIRQDDTMFGEIDPETGELKKRIPKFFINKFKSTNGRVQIGEKSYDFTKSLVLFSKMAYNYEEMSQIEATVLTMRDFISEKADMIITKNGNQLTDFVGNELASKLKGKDLDKVFQGFVDLYLYGVTTNPLTEDSTGKYEKIILEAKQYFTLKALGLGFVPAAGSFLAAKIQTAIEGFKGQIYTSEQYRNSMKLVYSERPKFHAMYSFFDPMNVEYDFFSVGKERTGLGDPREHNKIKKYVNNRLLMRPFSKGDEFLDEVIMTSMAQNWYINEAGELRRIRNDVERQQYKNESLWSRFEYNNETGKATIRGLNEDQTNRVIIDFRNAAQAAQGRIKGMIPEDDKAIWQTQIVGQLLMHFKSWMPGIIRERIGKVKYNDALQTMEMGRLTAFKQEMYNVDQLGTIEFMKSIVLPKLVDLGKRVMFLRGKNPDTALKASYEMWIEKNQIYKGKVTFDDYKDAYMAQIKTLIVELRMILAFAALVALLGADFDDDGKKFYQEMWLTRKLVAILKKTEAETSFVYNPKEFAKMIKNPIPLAGVLVDATNVLANTYDEAIDITLGEKMPLPFHNPATYDSTPLLYYSSKTIPGINQVTSLFEIFGE